MNLTTLKKDIQALEKKYSQSMEDWKKEDTLVSYFRRNGLNAIANAFEKDYKKLGLL